MENTEEHCLQPNPGFLIHGDWLWNDTWGHAWAQNLRKLIFSGAYNSCKIQTKRVITAWKKILLKNPKRKKRMTYKSIILWKKIRFYVGKLEVQSPLFYLKTAIVVDFTMSRHFVSPQQTVLRFVNTMEE